jgi:uncharacterized protein (DUF1697 family)
MTINIAFLRGINVGGHNKIKMAELRDMFESMGFQRVQTYIQSGNVLFASECDTETLRIQIEQEIEKVFTISITVIIRTKAELEEIIKNCPFSETILLEAASSKIETFYVSLLLDSPAQEKVEQLDAFQSESDEFRIQHREVYLLLRDGIRNSRLANNLYKLNVSSTMRNWKTINKINTLAKAMED